jgi:hypothetical protein
VIMSHDDLVSYFEAKLDEMIFCGNMGCECLSILQCPQLSLTVANYLAWFEHCSKHKQDSIILQWVIYRKSAKNYLFITYHLMGHALLVMMLRGGQSKHFAHTVFVLLVCKL